MCQPNADMHDRRRRGERDDRRLAHRLRLIEEATMAPAEDRDIGDPANVAAACGQPTEAMVTGYGS
jgi:hypothetical protein